MNEYNMKLSKEKKQEKIILLREWISIISNIKLQTPKNYEALSEMIFRKTHSIISVSTIKRVMGYLPGYGKSASITTLNILSKYVGFESFNDFVNYTDNSQNAEELSISDKTDVKYQIRSIRLELTKILQKIENLERIL